MGQWQRGGAPEVRPRIGLAGFAPRLKLRDGPGYLDERVPRQQTSSYPAVRRSCRGREDIAVESGRMSFPVPVPFQIFEKRGVNE